MSCHLWQFYMVQFLINVSFLLKYIFELILRVPLFLWFDFFFLNSCKKLDKIFTSLRELPRPLLADDAAVSSADVP